MTSTRKDLFASTSVRTLSHGHGEGCRTLLINPPGGSQFQLSLLYGALLGDASIYPRKGIIQIEQGLGHGHYLFWLFQV